MVNVDLSASGSLKFQTVEFTGQAYFYTFEGASSPDGSQISGKLVRHSRNSPGDIREHTIRGFPIEVRQPQNPLFGRYSNAQGTGQASGDTVGAELYLFSFTGSAPGFIIFYESYWDEPTFVPFTLSKIDLLTPTKFNFEIVTPDGLAKYTASLSVRQAVIRRIDGPAAAADAGITLRKSTRALPFDCPPAARAK
jgi:hypothetical protein